VRRYAALALLPLALAACGSSSKKTSSTTATAQSSSADFIQAANKVCQAADKRVFKIGHLGPDPKGWAKTAASAKRAIIEMRKVTPPAGDEAQFQKMLRYANALSLTIQEIHHSLVKKDIATAAAGQFAAAQLQDRVHQMARDLGLTFCQQPFTNWPA
jgi:hypothetical protein